MQIDLSTVLGAFATLCSVSVGAWLATARVAIANREKEIDRRIDEVRTKAEAIDMRLHTEEKATIRQDGDMNRVNDAHSNLTEDISEIKRTMATKTELQHISRTTDKILERIDGPQRRFTPGASSYVGQTSTDPPKTPLR